MVGLKMGDLSKNFSRSEFSCPCCGTDTIDAELIRILQDVRDKFGPIKINSGVRCVEHNKSVGGSENSQHLKGRAADIVPLESDLETVFRFIDENHNNTGLSLYSSFIHVDSRGRRVRW